MRRQHSPCLEGLETRQLLTRGHFAAALAARPAHLRAAAHVAHPTSATPAPAAAKPTLVVDGTLNVDNAKNGSSTTTSMDGSSTTSVLVMGTLSTLGPVEGTWTQSLDSTGANAGPDVLRLKGAAGTIVLALNDVNVARPIPAGHGAAYTEYAQRLVSASGTYAGSTEAGSVELFARRAGSAVTSLILHTRGA